MPDVGGVGGSEPPPMMPILPSGGGKSGAGADPTKQTLTPKEAVQAAIKMIMAPAIIKNLKKDEARRKQIAKGDV